MGPAEIKTNARSSVINDFGGLSEYRIAIQGTNQPGLLATARSSGNVRIRNAVMQTILEGNALAMRVDVVA